MKRTNWIEAAKNGLKGILFLCLFLLLFTSCMSWGYQPPETFHYTMDYLSYTEDDSLVRKDSLPYQIWIQPIEIPRTYSRRQIVIRHFGPKVSFSDNNLWAGRLNDYYPRLMTSRLHSYNSFRNASMDFLTTQPDFDIDMTLQRMELLQSDTLNEAHLDIDFMLSVSGTRELVVVHNARRVRSLYSGEIDLFVQTVNELLLEEMDKFIEKIYRHFDSSGPEEESGMADQTEDSVEREASVAEAPEGQGILLMPSLSGISGIGSYRAAGSQGNEYFGEYGVDLPLPQGEYTVEYGSGSRELAMIRRNIEVRRGYRTLVEPDWGSLTVDIVNERREPQADIIYELYEVSTGRSFGAEYPAREDLGDTPRIWHLEPGLYKVTIDNAPFSTFRNFTTIIVEERKHKRVTIVVERDEVSPPKMIGAGILDDDQRRIAEGNWRYSSAIYGDFNFMGEHSREHGSYNLDFSAQWDNNLRFATGPFSYSLIHHSEIGFNLSEEDVFRINEDDFDLKNSGVIDIFRGMGLYARFDLNTHFFNQYGDEDSGSGEILLNPSFFPLRLKEGVGLNFRLLHTPRSSLTLRGGFGLQQDYTTGVSTLEGDEIEDESSAGIELSAIGIFQPLPRLQFTTSADALFPFLEGENINLDVESGLNITLLRYLSFNYRFIMNNIAQVGSGEFDLGFEHRLVLRLTYILN
jgi:uncharacterized lipoprotein YmbA